MIIKVRVGDQEVLTVAEGDGPVNALDRAARKALERLYPAIGEIRLTDYKVRVLDSDKASAAKVRVLIESTDGHESWTTIGVSTDIINASWQALVDAMEYKLMRDQEAKQAAAERHGQMPVVLGRHISPPDVARLCYSLHEQSRWRSP